MDLIHVHTCTRRHIHMYGKTFLHNHFIPSLPVPLSHTFFLSHASSLPFTSHFSLPLLLFLSPSYTPSYPSSFLPPSISHTHSLSSYFTLYLSHSPLLPHSHRPSLPLPLTPCISLTHLDLSIDPQYPSSNSCSPSSGAHPPRPPPRPYRPDHHIYLPPSCSA